MKTDFFPPFLFCQRSVLFSSRWQQHKNLNPDTPCGDVGCRMHTDDFRTTNMQAHVWFYAFRDCDWRPVCPLFARAPEHLHGWESRSIGKHVTCPHR